MWILNTVSHQKASNVRYCYPSTHSGHGIKVYKGTSLPLRPFALHCLSCPLGNTGVASEESPSVLRSRRQNAQAKQEDKKGIDTLWWGHTPSRARLFLDLLENGKKKWVPYLSCYYLKFLLFATPCDTDSPFFTSPLAPGSLRSRKAILAVWSQHGSGRWVAEPYWSLH